MCPGEKAAKEGRGSVQRKITKKPRPQTETKCVFEVLRGYLEQWK